MWQDGLGQEDRAFSAQLSDQAYLKGEHLSIEEPHVYADIMDLVDAIKEDRPPLATGEQARHVVEIIETSMLALSYRLPGMTEEYVLRKFASRRLGKEVDDESTM